MDSTILPELERCVSLLQKMELDLTLKVLQSELSNKGLQDLLPKHVLAKPPVDKIVLPKEQKPKTNVFVCSFPGCGSSFSCIGNLNRHMKRHLAIKPYKCKICDKRFSRKDDLNKHLITHNNRKPYKCPKCLCEYKRITGLKSHLLNKHGMKYSDMPPEHIEKINRLVKESLLEVEKMQEACSNKNSKTSKTEIKQKTNTKSTLPLKRKNPTQAESTIDHSSISSDRIFSTPKSDTQNTERPITNYSGIASSMDSIGNPTQSKSDDENIAGCKHSLQDLCPNKLHSMIQSNPEFLDKSNMQSDPSVIKALPLQHDDHIDLLLSNGLAYCGESEQERILDTRDLKRVRCESELCNHNAAESLEMTHESGHHVHQEGCGHPMVIHDDHIDFLVDNELHHQNQGSCTYHGELDIKPFGSSV